MLTTLFILKPEFHKI